MSQDPKISSFKDSYFFLSNFFPIVVTYDGVTYPTVEHAYIAAKTLDKEIRKKVRAQSTPGEAKKMGKTLTLREDWEDVKLFLMENLLSQKFAPGTILCKMLLSTYPMQLEEGNWWGDTYWGVCKGVGENHLGKLLMKIRGEVFSFLLLRRQSGLKDLDIKARARAFASYAHFLVGQRRKYTNTPYIEHPKAVSEIVASVPHTEAMICASWLHDTIEDTPVTLKMIQDEFGEEVADLVWQLTDVSNPTDGNRQVRKDIDRVHLSKASPEAKTIKLADLIHNSDSILEHDVGFARVYLKEKRALLEVLKEGDTTLLSKAWSIVDEAEHKLKLVGDV